MNIKLELIDELRKRANVNYEDAKNALEKCNGDIVEALIYLEKQNKTKANACDDFSGKEFTDGVKKVIDKGNRTKLLIKKDNNVVAALPITLIVIALILFHHISVVPILVIIIVAMHYGYKFKLQKHSSEDTASEKKSDSIDLSK